ncbi:YugN family protein [Paenibacillus aurantius]|uniref:YugN family protein n=1 Tax=Paenibacillus aurantius TaxID=2918900 RepID=A0AA96RFP3_9BACL|nr:YugN family protein [Paenibacillus aurantius]WNQ13645.1 YugN family protein [Paenibacillus aurantius]
MIIENAGLKGLKSDLAHLDEVTEKLGFFRGQWESYRATYDYKMTDKNGTDEYYLRINSRVESGKLENPYSILVLTETYIGKTSFPHGLDYDAPIPPSILKEAQDKIAKLKQLLAE